MKVARVAKVMLLLLVVAVLQSCGGMKARVEPCRVPLAVHKGRCGHISVGREWRW